MQYCVQNQIIFYSMWISIAGCSQMFWFSLRLYVLVMCSLFLLLCVCCRTNRKSTDGVDQSCCQRASSRPWRVSHAGMLSRNLILWLHLVWFHYSDFMKTTQILNLECYNVTLSGVTNWIIITYYYYYYWISITVVNNITFLHNPALPFSN